MKKKIKTFITTLIITLLFTTGIGSAYASSFSQSTLDGVVYIITAIPNYVEENKVFYAAGTGFFVGKTGENPQYILTNCHVIEDFLVSGGGAGPGKLEIAYDKDTYEEAYVVTYNKEKDIAVLKLSKPTKNRSALKLKTVDETAVGTPVFAVGYPYTSDGTINAVNYYGKNDATVTAGTISRMILESGTGTQLLQMDVNINSGNSGGPLVDPKGDVLGIDSYGSSLDDDMNYAVSIEEAIPLLKNNNIPYEIAKDFNFNKLLIPVIAAVIILFGIIILIIALSRGKKKKMYQPAPNIPVLGQQVFETNQQVPVRQPAVAILRLMSSQHLGKSVTVTSQPVYIGRDPSVCRIVYKEGTPGVSSKHCQIYYDDRNQVFILTDLKSTYGTFLAGGKKLDPNVPYPLKVKDSFYLGEKDNLIYVDME
ncbi:trypsin-like peptidase domain-containing protein [Anaerocolumna chitinilytica]|uniref:FHA domain-containing protein n=1 Tax=Anaerocolumna chitinilytica TaxID=1727145 RepID=A0A7I8DLG9_9FIRM|nr:trypsin-like peptidase domain-containing protein [Anaerocolumna chitinilytica]BCJ99210.1 hypothetical protein bsdcttw_22510 [Anaerocolumna chitinilytica]